MTPFYLLPLFLIACFVIITALALIVSPRLPSAARSDDEQATDARLNTILIALILLCLALLLITGYFLLMS